MSEENTQIPPVEGKTSAVEQPHDDNTKIQTPPTDTKMTADKVDAARTKSKPGFLDNYAEVLEDFEARNTTASKGTPDNESDAHLVETHPPVIDKPNSTSTTEATTVPSYSEAPHVNVPPSNLEAQTSTNPQSSAPTSTNTIAATDTTSTTINENANDKTLDNAVSSGAPAVNSHNDTALPPPAVTIEDDKIETNEEGVPVDMEAAMEYLLEPLKQYQEVSLSENLLLRKKEEDEGVQPDSDFEGEDFEDLLELFDIDPDEISLDLTLMERQRMLVESFDSNQLDRYEYFRRANLSNAGIKKLVSQLTGQTITSEFSKMLAGIGKVFVGEIVERAKDAQRRQDEAKVEAQLEYKRKLREYELEIEERSVKKSKMAAEPVDLQKEDTESKDEEKVVEEDEEEAPKRPEPPLIELPESRKVQAKRSILDEKDTSANYRVIIPDESEPLTPDHIREAWRVYQDETENVIKGGWRKQGGGDGNMFR